MLYMYMDGQAWQSLSLWLGYAAYTIGPAHQLFRSSEEIGSLEFGKCPS